MIERIAQRIGPSQVAGISFLAGAGGSAFIASKLEPEGRRGAVNACTIGAIGSYFVAKALLKHDVPTSMFKVMPNESIATIMKSPISRGSRWAAGIAMFASIGGILGAGTVDAFMAPQELKQNSRPTR